MSGGLSQEDLKRLQLQEAQDVRDVMATIQGRRLLCKVIERSGIYKCSSTGQTNTTFFNEGGRNQGLQLLLEIIKNAPESYQLMLKENSDDS